MKARASRRASTRDVAKKHRVKKKRPMSARSIAFFKARKEGLYGRGAHIKCEECGVNYESFRGGHTFKTARREIITIGVDKKTGKTKYGRRNGTLGYMKELKQLAWKAHIAECSAARKVA